MCECVCVCVSVYNYYNCRKHDFYYFVSHSLVPVLSSSQTARSADSHPSHTHTHTHAFSDVLLVSTVDP